MVCLKFAQNKSVQKKLRDTEPNTHTDYIPLSKGHQNKTVAQCCCCVFPRSEAVRIRKGPRARVGENLTKVFVACRSAGSECAEWLGLEGWGV